MPRILYIEDEALLGRIVQESLSSRGYRIDWYTDGGAAGAALDHADQYDIAVLDIMLPGEDGFTLGRQLREKFPHFPIIFLTARTQGSDVVQGFQAGCNDYLRKPFSMEELIVRIDNQLKIDRSAGDSSEDADETIFPVGDFSFDYHRLELSHRSGRQMPRQLSHREGEILRYLVERPDQIIKRQELLLSIWEDDSIFNSRTLDVYIRKLRKLLSADQNVKIITLRGVGYRMVME